MIKMEILLLFTYIHTSLYYKLIEEQIYGFIYEQQQQEALRQCIKIKIKMKQIPNVREIKKFS